MEAVEFRELRGNELREARAAKNDADIMRGEFQVRYPRWSKTLPGEQPAPEPADKEEEAARIEAAYKAVMEQYPGTETAAYCGIRLSGWYQYRGDKDRAVQQAEQVAAQFAGTPYASKADFNVGLIYLQALHKPREAAIWFKKIPKPSDSDVVGDDRYDMAEMLYLSAQTHIAKCELAVGEKVHADLRYERLTGRYPQYQEYIEDTRDTESRVALEQLGGVDPQPILEERIARDPLLSGEVAVPSDAGVAGHGPQRPGDLREHASPVLAATAPTARSTTHLRRVGVGLLCIGVVLCFLGVFRLYHRHDAGKEGRHA